MTDHRVAIEIALHLVKYDGVDERVVGGKAPIERCLSDTAMVYLR